MSDSDDYPLPPNLKLVPSATPTDSVSERGARPVDPPKPDTRTIGPEADELRTLVAKIITVLGGRRQTPGSGLGRRRGFENRRPAQTDALPYSVGGDDHAARPG